jgi:hypothetical protein
MSLQGAGFSTIDLLAYEPFPNRNWSQGATKKASEISTSYAIADGPLWLSLGATSWVIPG